MPKLQSSVCPGAVPGYTPSQPCQPIAPALMPPPTFGPTPCNPPVVTYPCYPAPTPSGTPPIQFAGQTPSSTPVNRETLGVREGVTPKTVLRNKLSDVEITERETGEVKISFTSPDPDFRLGFAKLDGSYTEGGGVNQAHGRTPDGREFTTSSVRIAGTYKVELEHGPQGSIRYTVTIDPSVDKLRLDVGKQSLLLSREELCTPEPRTVAPQPTIPEQINKPPVPLPESLKEAPTEIIPNIKSQPRLDELPGRLPPPPRER